MDKISIPEQDVVSLDRIGRDVFGLRILMVNVYGIRRSATEWVLVDTGLPHSRERIEKWAAGHFGGVPPIAIVLTHGHFDHTGSVEDMAHEWRVPIYAHSLEMPYLTGQTAYPPPDPLVGGGLMALLSKFYPRDPVNLGSAVQPVPEDHSVPELPGWKWVHTPGHSVGHISLFRV